MKNGIIYEWRNKLDGKFYVGQTIRPKARYNAHIKAEGDSVFHRAIRKHGIENFEYSVVATYEHETFEGLYVLLNEAEKERIKFRNSLAPNGYNVADGGKNGNAIAGFTQEQLDNFKKKISKGTKGKLAGENNPMFGKHHSDEIRDKISKAHKGKPGANKGKHLSDETKKKISKANKGRKHSDEARAKMSKTRKGRKVSDETRAKMIKNNAMRGKTHSDEARAKMSKALKGKFAGENHPMFGKHMSDEARAKISKAIKGKHWYNNGIDEGQYFDGEQPEGWVRGRIKGKLTAWNKGKTNCYSDETRAKMSIAKKGKSTWNKGNKGMHWYTNGIDSKQYFEDKQPEGWVRGRLSKTMKGKHWYNNGIDDGKYFDGEQPEGWVRGKIKGNKNTHWYTNGIDSKQYFEGKQPEGWVRGRIKNVA